MIIFLTLSCCCYEYFYLLLIKNLFLCSYISLLRSFFLSLHRENLADFTLTEFYTFQIVVFLALNLITLLKGIIFLIVHVGSRL